MRGPFILAGAAIVVAIVFVLLPDVEAARRMVRDVGVYTLWGVVVVFAYGLYQARSTLAAVKWFDGRAALYVLAMAALAHLHFPHQFKILADEMVLVGVSRSIHEEREVATPVSLIDVQGARKIGFGYLDKRPFFFSFLVAVLHDLTGYRPANSIILNALLTPIFLYLIYLVTREVTRQKLAGYLAVAMTLAVPIYAHNFTGGGFEVLNVTLIAALFLWTWLYVRIGGEEMQIGLVALALLAAYTRYESVLYVLAAIAIIAVVQVTRKRYVLQPVVALTPLLAIPLGCIFRGVASMKEQFFQLADKGSQTAFSLSFIPRNTPPALAFLFSNDHVQMGSLWISGLCVVGGLFGLLRLPRTFRKTGAERAGWALIFVPLAVLANMLVLLSYHWGQLEDPLVSRLALPFITLLIVFATWALSLAVAVRKVLLGAGLLCGYAIYAHAIPVATKNSYARAYGPARELEAIQTFMVEHADEDALILTDRPITWVCYGFWTDEVRSVLARQDHFEKLFASGRYSRIYVQQRLTADAAAGTLSVNEAFKLPENWVVEELVRKRLSDTEATSISRIVSIREGAVDDVSPSLSAPAAAGESLPET